MERGRHLRLVAAEPPPAEPEDLDAVVRQARRDMARLLRALQASGRGIASWPDEVVTRLAHVDSVTARYLIDPGAVPQDAASTSAAALRSLERWVLGCLSATERAQVRAFELMIRIDDAELEAPLLRPDGAPEEQDPSLWTKPLRSLRAGLQALADDELAAVGRRLGVRPLALEKRAGAPPHSRSSMEAAIIRMIRDDHLLSILLSTLSAETHELLAALVRGRLPRRALEALAAEPHVAAAVGAGPVAVTNPATQLRSCGLAFLSEPGPARVLWVPVELQRRLDGVLRAFGV